MWGGRGVRKGRGRVDEDRVKFGEGSIGRSGLGLVGKKKKRRNKQKKRKRRKRKKKKKRKHTSDFIDMKKPTPISFSMPKQGKLPHFIFSN